MFQFLGCKGTKKNERMEFGRIRVLLMRLIPIFDVLDYLISRFLPTPYRR